MKQQKCKSVQSMARSIRENVSATLLLAYVIDRGVPRNSHSGPDTTAMTQLYYSNYSN